MTHWRLNWPKPRMLNMLLCKYANSSFQKLYFQILWQLKSYEFPVEVNKVDKIYSA